MSLLIAIISIIWAAGTLKLILFWMYLWQLKDYHIGRFVDHFRTAKGKRIIFSYGTQFFVWRLKKPVFTAKVIFLTGLITLVAIGYLALVVSKTHSALTVFIALLIFNVLIPVIVSVIVLAAQPFFIRARNKILQKAKEKIGRFSTLKVIAITGSYGKTSTKEFLSTILSEKFKVLATPDHKNSEIGIAQTILQELNSSHEIFIVEMGAYNKGGIQLLCDMVHPDMGIVTGVNEQHLATFGSLENLLSAEGGRELLENLPGKGLLIVNGENKYCVDLYKRAKIDKKIYAISKEKIDADMWAEEVSLHLESFDFVARAKTGELAHLHVGVLGKQHVQNVLGAVLAARAMGMGTDQIAHGVNRITQKQGGMSLKKGVHGITVIDSSYSANPDGVAADLEYLSIFPGKKVIVIPCLIELGAKSIEAHIQIGKKIAEVCDLAIITTKDKFEEIRNGAIMNGMDVKNIMFCENSKEIMAIIGAHCKVGDAVLLEGRVPGELIRLLNG